MFFLAILLAITVGHIYLWKRLVYDTLRGRPARIAGTVALILLTVLLLAAQGAGKSMPPSQARWLAWPGYLWLAMVLYLTLALLVLEIPRLVIRLRMRRTERAQAGLARTETAVAVREAAESEAGESRTAESDIADLTAGTGTGPAAADTLVADPPAAARPPGTRSVLDRRLFLGRAMAATAGVVAAGTVAYGVRTVLAGPTLKYVTVPLHGLHPDLEGFRVAVVSDIHASATAGHAHVERIVNTINAADAHAVSIVGDLQDGTVTNLRSAVAPLRDIVAPEGAYFVTGNHEYYSDWHAWLRHVARLGIHPLRNERTALSRGHGRFDLAGVNDITGTDHHDAPDYAKALADRDTDRPVVLMAHQPVQVDQAAAHGVDLQISGHTHGGQLWPFHYIVRAAQPALSGLSRVDTTWLYVTRGAGYFGPPVRVGAQPDVTVITLARA